jgi:hypothetical protein
MSGDLEPNPLGINWNLLESLDAKKHPLLHVADSYPPEVGIGIHEVLIEARTAHHLLDMAGVPNRHTGRQPDASDLSARTWLLLIEVNKLRGQVERIAGWHSREAHPGGMVGDFCNECGTRWPCDTNRIANGTYDDDAEVDE